MCDLWHVICHTTINSSALLFLKKNFSIEHSIYIMPFRNNSVKQNRLEDQNWKKRWRKCHMFKCCYEPQASIKPVNDCHQMTFLTTRSTARILIRYLCHRRGLPLRCPAFLLREGRPDTREQQQSNLGYPLSLKLLRLISLLCHHLKAINNILMPTLSQYVNLVYLIRSYDSLYCVTQKS